MLWNNAAVYIGNLISLYVSRSAGIDVGARDSAAVRSKAVLSKAASVISSDYLVSWTLERREKK